MRISPIVASTFRSDGGAMFGLVPKPMWSQLIPPNERNAIPQNANGLLLETDDGELGLVDTGCGSRELFKERDALLHDLAPGWPLEAALNARGKQLGDVSFVILTHAHWDHAGGLLRPDGTGTSPSFPHARVYLHAREWDCAMGDDPLLGKSYPPSVREALAALPSEQRVLVKGDDEEILPGVRLARTGGHTEGHCAVIFDGKHVSFQHPEAPEPGSVPEWVFASDVCPTQHHLRMVFQTAYDTYPLETRAWKRAWLPRLAESGGVLLFCHDPKACGALLQAEERMEFKASKTWAASLTVA